MRVPLLMLATMMAVGPRAAVAQAAQAQCTGTAVPVQDACQMALDLFQYLNPQLGISLTGGNVIPSQGGTVGGLLHSSVGARLNVVAGSIPTMQTPSATGVSSHSFATKDQYIGLPSVEATIGLYRGFPIGPIEVGGLDALVSAVYVPSLKTSDVSGGAIAIEPDSPISIGYGARLGLIDETVIIPGLGVSVMMRSIPTTSILATVGTDSLQVKDFTLKTLSWRVTTGKSFMGFSLAAGIGQDQYDAETGIEAVINRPVIGRVTTGNLTDTQKITRTNYFANVALNLLAAKLVAEGGVISGGPFTTFNRFDIDGDASRVYGSAALRIGF
jgi:hypothetical protein